MQECDYCLTQYEPERTTSKYCSDKCRVQSSRGGNSHIRELNQLLKKKGLPTSISPQALKVKFQPSGIREIDDLTGGFPKNRVTEIFGMKGVGKTSLVAKLFHADSKILYIDTENALAETPENVVRYNEYILENITEIVDAALKQKKYDIVVVDSVATMVPRAEVEGDPGDSHMGLKARLMSQWMRRINLGLERSGTALVFINQQRESMNPYGPVRFTPGGFALPYAASLRLELKSNKADRIIKDKETVGHWVNVEVEKSRICKPYQKTKFKLSYKEGK